MHLKIEVGKDEKHWVEFKNNPWNGVEEVLIDGKVVYKKFRVLGFDQTFEVGEREKHRVRVRSGFLEFLHLKPIFTVDGEKSVAQIQCKGLQPFFGASPENRFANTVGLGFGLGILNIIVGVLVEIFHVDGARQYGIGIYSVIGGGAILLLTYWYNRKASKLALGCILGLLLLDAISWIIKANQTESMHNTESAMVFRVFLMFLFCQGFWAAKPFPKVLVQK